MKNFVCLLTFIVLCFTQAVFAGDFSAITKNPKLTQSLEALEKVNKREVISILNGNNKTGKPIRVMFRELEIYGLSKCEAATLRTKAGGVVVYINKKYQDAPAEAIACLIAHESQHSALTGTKAEEVRAWLREVTAWNSIVRYNPQIVNNPYPLLKRFKYINKLYVADNNGPKKIEEVIASHPVYANLH